MQDKNEKMEYINSKFSIEKFKEICSFKVKEFKKEETFEQCYYLFLEDDYLDCLKISTGNFQIKNNCINIYTKNDRKFGFWWNGEINYDKLNNYLEEVKDER